MGVQDRSTQTENIRRGYRDSLRILIKHTLKFLSSLLVPLMLGVFTVVITIHQQKTAREQRIEDLQLIREQREQDLNISIKNQELQSKVVADQYRDSLLVAYIKEIGDLLENNNGSLTSNQLINTLARMKTRNVIRQLDGSRQAHVIHFLFEAGQLTNTEESTALNLSKTKLIDIDFSESISLKIKAMSLIDLSLQNCTFEKMMLVNVSFSSTLFDNVNFSSTNLVQVNFRSAHFYNTNFSLASFFDIDFSSASFNNVDFSSVDTLDIVKFISARLENVNFLSAKRIGNASFSLARLDNINFSSAWLASVDFSFSSLNRVNFSSVSFAFGLTRFNHTRMAFTTFEKCHCVDTDFTSANLKNASFHSATLTNAIFSLANLQNADFTNTNITDDQLQSALSIRNAKLPNGTFGQGRNLIKNGDANCNISLVDHWHVHNGSIVVIVSHELQNQCQFSVQSMEIEATISQRIDLISIMDPSFWIHSNIELQAQMSNGVSIELIAKSSNDTFLNKKILQSTDDKINMNFMHYIEEIELLVKFNAQMVKSNTEKLWCDNIKLFINYDILQ